MLKGRLLPALAVVAFFATTLPVAAQSPTLSAEEMIAAINGMAGKMGRAAPMPRVLNDADAARYQAAFAAQDRGQWAMADRELAHIQDPMLLGHVLAERYLSAGYKIDAREIRGWMASYADLPEADDIYELGRSRLGLANLKAPIHPAIGQPRQAGNEYDMWEDFSADDSSRHLRTLKSRFRALVRQGHTEQAIASLSSSPYVSAFDKIDIDEMKTYLAMMLFDEGDDRQALRWASEAAERSGDRIPAAHWLAGLSLWRDGHKAQSAAHFEAVANSRAAPPGLVSAGAYWAARANLAARRPQVVNHWLRQAAGYPRNFYGVLARRALGQDVPYSWEFRPFTDLDSDIVARTKAGRRALALLQIGDRSRAEDELRRLAGTATPALAQALIALAATGEMPGLAVTLAAYVETLDGRSHDSAVYPIPGWQPPSGWSVDQALILAIIRQESSFNPRARSGAGAVGLMQLLPATARAMRVRGHLAKPEVNLEAGQRYVHHLLNDDLIKGNLLFLAASYNGGPGNVSRWLKAIHHGGDALLFLESIPSHQTRHFVERVLTNYWAYRNRLGQPTPSLSALAAGEWPMYDGETARPARLVQH